MVDEIIQVIREISSRNDHDSELFLMCPSSPYRKGQFEAVSCISSRPIKLCVTGRIRGRDHSATRDQSEETRRASKKGGGRGKKERKKSCQRKKRKEEMAMQKLLLGMAVAMIAVGMVSAQMCEVVEDWKIPTGEYRVSDLYINGPSFGPPKQYK